MQRFKYLIVGGGMTADAAVKGIREVDGTGSIGIISADSDPPYQRPPLTKSLWKGGNYQSIWLDTESSGVDVMLERSVISIDPGARTVRDDAGETHRYQKLLLATGGTPRRLPFPAERALYYRTAADYRRLRDITELAQRFTVIGGGFIGSEIAAALAMNGKQVAMLFPGEAIGANVYPADLARHLNDYFRDHGVDLHPGTTVTGIEQRGNVEVVVGEDGDGQRLEIETDFVVVGIGIEPNTKLARETGIAIDNGIMVDEYLNTSRPNILAAGDVANFRNPALNQRMRVEHEDNATTMGRVAGLNMAGRATPYDHLPYFYSDLFDLGYEAVGDLDSSLETFSDWKTPFEEGTVYYLREGTVRGVLLWNVWERVGAARRLIASHQTVRTRELVRRLAA